MVLIDPVGVNNMHGN